MKCECGKKARAKGLCETCYQRQRRRNLGMKPAVELGDSRAITLLLPTKIYTHIEQLAELTYKTKAEIIRKIIEQHFPD